MAGAATDDPAEELVQRVLKLPQPAATQIFIAAEVLSLLDFCGTFPVDSRLVAQAHRHASLLGRAQRQMARAAPLCMLVDIAALQRRPGALEGCLRWLLCLPNLQMVQFADGGKGSMLSEAELELLLQLAAAHPAAADSLRHIRVYTRQLGARFDAGVLAPLTGLRSVQLQWYWSADLARLPPSVRSVELQLPGNAFQQDYVQRVQRAGHPEVAAQLALDGMYRQLGMVQPLSAMPRHTLEELTVDADWLPLVPLHLRVGQLCGGAAAVRLLQAGSVQLLLPEPADSKGWRQLLRRAQQTGGIGADKQQLAQLCAFALLDAFRASAGLQAAQLCALRWELQLPVQTARDPTAGGGQPARIALPSDRMLKAVNEALEGAPWQFRRLQTAGSGIVHGELQLSLRRATEGSGGFLGWAASGCWMAFNGAAGAFRSLLRFTARVFGIVWANIELVAGVGIAVFLFVLRPFRIRRKSPLAALAPPPPYSDLI